MNTEASIKALAEGIRILRAELAETIERLHDAEKRIENLECLHDETEVALYKAKDQIRTLRDKQDLS